MEHILQYLKKRGGFARMSDLRAASFQTRDIARMVREGSITKVKAGLYKLPDITHQSSINLSFIEISHSVPKGIIALASALAHHELTTFVPSEIYVAIPQSAKPPKIDYPPVRFFYFPERFYHLGIEKIKTNAGIFSIYDKEKTICDIFRYRNKIGENLALEGLKTYLRRKDSNINKLYQYAEVCKVKTILIPYLKAHLS